MYEVIRISRKSIWVSVGLSVLQTLLLSFALLLTTGIPWPPSLDEGPSLIVAAMCFWIGLPGLCHLIKMQHRKRHLGELDFDGTTVSVRIPGLQQQAFTQSDVKGYFPYRHEILLNDNRLIVLPTCMSHFHMDKTAMVLPWSRVWWPNLDVAASIQQAEDRQKWLRYLPNISMLLALLTVVLFCFYPKFIHNEFGVTIIFPLLFLQFLLPDCLEHFLRRKVVVYFAPSNTAEMNTS